jgi:EmrB/QacA subfamily drug resistance transporter
MGEGAEGMPQSAGGGGTGARRVALIVAAAFFMQNLDGVIINTSLPQMASVFRVGPADLNVGITAYMLSTAAFVPLSGWVADRLGARRVFAGAIVIFTLASVVCGLSQNLWEFSAARVVQGLGGALMTPVGRMVVLRSADKADLLAATALLTWPALIAPVIGPVLGGFITTYVSWRWNFLLNAPLGAVGVALVLAFVPGNRSTVRTRFDLPGFALTSAALVAILLGLEGLTGPRWTFAGFSVLTGLGLGAAAVRHLGRREGPLLDLSPLKVPTFTISTVDAGNLFRLTISATPFLLPLMFQVAFGLTAWAAGLYVLAYFAGNLLMKTVTTPALRRFGFRNVLVGNGVLAGAAILACAALTPTTPALIVVLVLLAAGLTRSMQFTALATLTFADIEAPLRGSSSTLSSMLQQLSIGLGIALAAVLINVSQSLRGADHLALADFRLAFIVVGLIAMAASALFLRLDADAGAEVSGRRPQNATA